MKREFSQVLPPYGLLCLAIRFAFLLFVDGPVARLADAFAAVRRNEEVRPFRSVRGVATQARHLFARMQRIRNFGNRMRRPGMSETQAGIEFNFWGRFELGLRNGLQPEEVYCIPRAASWRVALQAERIQISACLCLEFRGMRIVADQALAVPVRTVNDRASICLVAPFT